MILQPPGNRQKGNKMNDDTYTPKYEVDERTQAMIDLWFTPDPAKDDQRQRYDDLETQFKWLAQRMAQSCPPSAHLTAALRKLFEAKMTAVAAIACSE